jgi:hypothetical protein
MLRQKFSRPSMRQKLRLREGRVITQESMRNLAAEVEERGRANLAAFDELMRRKGGEAPQPDED